MSMCVAVIHLFVLIFFFINSAGSDPRDDFLLFAILNSAAVTVLITLFWCREMHFFPIHHFDQIDTKMDLFLMKLLLLKFPGTPWQLLGWGAWGWGRI